MQAAVEVDAKVPMLRGPRKKKKIRIMSSDRKRERKGGKEKCVRISVCDGLDQKNLAHDVRLLLRNGFGPRIRDFDNVRIDFELIPFISL